MLSFAFSNDPLRPGHRMPSQPGTREVASAGGHVEKGLLTRRRKHVEEVVFSETLSYLHTMPVTMSSLYPPKTAEKKEGRNLDLSCDVTELASPGVFYLCPPCYETQ